MSSLRGLKGLKKDDKKKDKKEKGSSKKEEEERLKREEEEKRKKEEEDRKKRDEEERKKKEQKQKDEDERKRKKEMEEQAKQKEREEQESRELQKAKEEAHKKKEEKQREAQKREVSEAPQISDEDPKDEEEALEGVFPDQSFEKPLQYHQSLPEDVYSAFEKLQGFARGLNINMPVPEVVLVGLKGHGKASVVDAFFGEPLGHVGVATRRPIFYNLLNNQSCDSPKITIRKEGSAFEQDIVVAGPQVSAAIRERQQSSSTEPIVVNYESKYVCNLTLIDTPSLLSHDDTVSVQDRENFVLNLARPSQRLILAVETTGNWNTLRLPEIIKRVDPELSRTTFVYTKFQSYLSTVNTTREINKFFSGVLPSVKTYFLSMPSSAIREQNLSADSFKRKIYQAYLRDMLSLESLQYDKRNESFIGPQNLRKFLLNDTWRQYQGSVPKILKELRVLKKENVEQIKQLEKQLNGLDTSRLRVISSAYVVDFLQTVERLISGTTEGNPSVNGQNLEEEKLSHGGDWIDSYNRLIRYDPEEAQIPYWEHKLYGGQQFERLLSEFNYVSRLCKIDEKEITMEIIGTATGINKLNNVPNYISASCDLASQKVKQALKPLIEKLTHRASEIFKRTADIAERLLEARRREASSLENVTDVSRYSYFVYYVRDLYNNFVENVAVACKEKCMDEFLSPRTIYWDFAGDKQSIPTERTDSSETKQTVLKLATDIFNEQRERITKGVTLKFYNFFLVPLEVQLMNEIQSKINQLTDDQLENHFQLNSTREQLQEAIQKREEDSRIYVAKDKLFQELSTSFSHPLFQKFNQKN